MDALEEPALGYMEVVAQRDAPTLLPVIRDHVLPGTVVHSDECAAYRLRSPLVLLVPSGVLASEREVLTPERQRGARSAATRHVY